MTTIIFMLMVAVVAVLLMGIINLARGGTAEKSNKLMVWRVGLQGLIVLLLGAMFVLK